MKEWYLCTTWTEGVQRADVVKETPKQVVLRNGARIMRRYSQTQFLGNTREEAKNLYINKLQEELHTEMMRVRNLQERIETVKSW